VSLARILFVMTLGSTTGNLLFNLSTNANYELLAERLRDITRRPGHARRAAGGGVRAWPRSRSSWWASLIDRVALKTLYLGVIVVQGALLALATQLSGWAFYLALLAMHGRHLRRRALHRRHARALRGRPRALARGRAAVDGLARGELRRGVAARAHRQGRGLHARCCG
jgi:hypothetical protein